MTNQKGWHGDSKGHREARLKGLKDGMKFSNEDMKNMKTAEKKKESSSFRSIARTTNAGIKYGVYEEVILDAISTDGYDESANTPKEKLQFLKNRFLNEYGHEIPRVGEQEALTNWLQGLAIDIPFYNVDIIALAKDGGSLPQNPTERQEDKILENYWKFMAVQIMKMWKRNKINEYKEI